MLDAGLTDLSVWWIVPVVALLSAAALEIGFRFGRLERRLRAPEPPELSSDITVTVVGLLGLMLAFTFAWTASRFDDRRQARIDEAKAIAGLYHMIDALPAEERGPVRARLDRYIVARLQPITGAASGDVATRRDLWLSTMRAAQENPESQVSGAAIAAALRVLDANLDRSILAASSRLPTSIAIGLGAVLACTMALVGYRFGLIGAKRSPTLVFVVIALALVIYLIADLDRAIGGSIKLSDQPLRQLQNELRAWDSLGR